MASAVCLRAAWCVHACMHAWQAAGGWLPAVCFWLVGPVLDVNHYGLHNSIVQIFSNSKVCAKLCTERSCSIGYIAHRPLRYAYYLATGLHGILRGPFMPRYWNSSLHAA